ncbi:TPA: hypothetical protein PNM72_002888 [Listeria monocytogenes]|uniref:Uncharacterized protein n=3 Tax=Listeria TaxID=1637 RepID=A0A5L7YBJ8_LISMN|nr:MULTISPECIES: hypothetical protein [Listeria]EAE3702106.1 hypothetical protein [Listeria monocytogenes serotype 1/2c]EAE3752884.1 hypothetical protein [Listeria monocytogenes serotype 1/2a]EAG6257464.1 hypothetical protein [Listeria monocytogenes CFSAN003807]EHF3608983.1 hypothetical protein [Listeria innocua]AEO26671.1 hypothetical protein LMKG_02837 [Listeria monocytogenes FSL R2-561]
MSIIKKWWFWLICLLIIIGIGFTVWYTQVYTSEWGKGLSKEEKAVFEYAKETSNKSFDISSIDNKELDKLYSLLMDSGTYNKTIILDQNNLKKYSNKAYDLASKLAYVQKDFDLYKKELNKKRNLNSKAKEMMPYGLKNI